MKTLGLNLGNNNLLMKFCIICMLSMGMAPIVATASPPSGNEAITGVLCNAVNQLTGNIGRAIAILIVISLAIMLFLGKVTWGVAIAVGVGMGILFGAPQVVTILSGGQSPCP